MPVAVLFASDAMISSAESRTGTVCVGTTACCVGTVASGCAAFGYVIWSSHRDEVGERVYLTRVMQTAAEWTGVLINMNTDNVKESLQRLHDGTVGQLNADFDSSIQPYQQVVERLQSRSRGEVEAVVMLVRRLSDSFSEQSVELAATLVDQAIA